MLTGTNLETMTAITLMSYPFEGRPVYLALAPLTHAAGVLCFPVLALGGEIVVMRTPDVGAFLEHDRAAPGHPHVPAADADLHGARPSRRSTATDLSSLQCFWYGAAPMSATRLEEALTRIGPVMAQLFGQTEAPMMISTHGSRATTSARTGRVALERLVLGRATGSAGDGRRSWTEDGSLLPHGSAGEIVVRSSLVMRRLPPRPGGHRGGLGPRLAPHRRHRLPRRRQLPVHRRPGQGHGDHAAASTSTRPRSSRP